MDWTTEITVNDFKGELKLPFDKSDETKLNDIIQSTVDSIMSDMLGVTEYETFATYMETRNDEEAEAVAKWDNLWDGCTYDFEGEATKLIGARKMCVYFVCEQLFSYFQTQSGGYKNDISNATKRSSIEDTNYFNIIYNKGVSYYREAYNLIQYYDGVFYAHKEARWLM